MGRKLGVRMSNNKLPPPNIMLTKNPQFLPFAVLAEGIPATQHASSFWFFHTHPPFCSFSHWREGGTQDHTYLFDRALHQPTLRFWWDKLRLSCETGLTFQVNTLKRSMGLAESIPLVTLVSA
jgi:hypothetical protein